MIKQLGSQWLETKHHYAQQMWSDIHIFLYLSEKYIKLTWLSRLFIKSSINFSFNSWLDTTSATIHFPRKYDSNKIWINQSQCLKKKSLEDQKCSLTWLQSFILFTSRLMKPLTHIVLNGLKVVSKYPNLN